MSTTTTSAAAAIPEAPPIAPGTTLPPVPAVAIACLALAAFGSGVSLRINDALLPRLATEFSVALSQAAQVTSFFAVAYGIAQLMFGPLGDRYGKYRVVAWACVACAISAALCGLAPGFAELRLGRVLAGATAAAIIPLSMAWIGDVVPYEQRQPVLARFLIGQILGLSAGVWLGGFAADHFSWRAPYFAVASLFAVVSLGLLTLNRSLPAHARATQPVDTADPAQSGAAWRRVLSEFGQVLAVPWARVILLTVFTEGVFVYGPFAFIATHLHRSFGLTLSSAGSLVMLFGFGGLFYALASGRLVARLGETGLAWGGGALLASAFLLVGFAPAWGWSIPGCLMAGLGFYMLHNTLQVNATQMTPARRGAAVAAFASCFFLGQSAGVSLAALASERWGTASVLGIGALGVLAVAANFGRLRRAKG